MSGALGYLLSRSFFNALRARIGRLRQPKYLAAAILGGAYFYFYFYKFLFGGGFLHRPQVMFFDEPLTGLDPIAIRRTKDVIVQQARQGVAILISSHLLHLLEEVCSHVLILKKGEKIADGTLADVASRFSNGESDVSLEEIFIRATGGTEN